MRKYLFGSTVLTFALIVTVTACGKGNVKQATQASSKEATVAASEKQQESGDKTEGEESGEVLSEDQAKREGEKEFKDSPEKAAAYLKTYFAIQVPETAEGKAFSEALQKITEKEIPITGEFDRLKAISAAVDASGYRELAQSYTAEKLQERLQRYGLKGEGEELSPLVCALDVDLITPEEAEKAMNKDKPDKDFEEALLMKVADAVGKGRNFLGLASDPDIFGKLDKTWQEFRLFDDPKLSELGRKAVEQKITTGYGLKSSAYDARFLPEYTLQYGHSDILHARQLIGLLDREGLNARVQLEPKISIYQYLLEWGAVPEATPTYEVQKFSDDLYLVHAVEYDLKLEFANKEDLMAFDRVIKAFAKKNSENEERKGLLYGSWWQPLYSTVREDMPKEDYHAIYDCVVTDGEYAIHPFTTEEKKDEVVKSLTALAGGLTVTPEKRYVNTAFYHYLTGQDYQ